MPQVEEPLGDAADTPYLGARLYVRENKLQRRETKPNVTESATGKRIVIFRTKPAAKRQPDQQNETWIFSSKQGKWRAVNSTLQPDCGKGCSVAAMCDTHLLVFGGSVANSSKLPSTSAIVSVFLGDAERWSHVSVVNNGLFQPFQRDVRHAAMVAVKDPSTNYRYSGNCQCKESVLFFPPTALSSHTLLQLRCVVDRKQYAWREILPYSTLLPRMPTVVSLKDTGYVYIMAEDGLWKYDVKNNKWNAVINGTWSFLLPCGGNDLRASASEGKYFVYGSCRTVLYYDLSRRYWSSSHIQNTPDTIGLPEIYLDTGSVVLDIYDCMFEVWELGQGGSNNWMWTKVETISVRPQTNDRFLTSVMLGNEMLLVSSSMIGYMNQLHHVEENLNLELWRIGIETSSWERVLPPLQLFGLEEDIFGSMLIDTVTHLSSSLVVMTGLRRSSSRATSIMSNIHVWGYNPSLISIVYYNSSQKTDQATPIARYCYAVAALDESSILMFGGVLDTGTAAITNCDISFRSDKFPALFLDDTWIARIQVSSRSLNWARVNVVDHLRLNDSQRKTPTGRCKHTMVMTNHTLVMYGGQTYRGVCLNEIWHFDVSTMSWVIVTKRYHRPKLYGHCLSKGTRLGNDVVFAIECLQFMSDSCPSGGLQVWLYHPETFHWTFISVLRVPLIQYNVWEISIHVWRQYLVVYHSTEQELLYSRLVCPEGFRTTSPSDSNTFCSVCPSGSFSPKTDSQCISCPVGLTTEMTLSTSVSNCTQCVPDYCNNGMCVVVQEGLSPGSVCHCDAGYSGNRCQYPTYFLIATGLIAICLLAALGGFLVCRYRRRKNRREKKLVRKVIELTDVWQINGAEVTLMGRIGGGSYGEVFLADYRDMTVAIKILRCQEDQQSLREFEREIQFMQTVRHPNIVLSIGAGKQESDGTPFLVLEYMERGSLCDLLDDIAMELQVVRKVQFGVDIAMGMEFLHGLQPPRIHRDLKGGNILVSRNFTAKVADFGHGRQMPSLSDNKMVCESTPEGLTTPLLNTPSLTLRDIGTSRWRAPELSAHQNYTTAVDVYR